MMMLQDILSECNRLQLVPSNATLAAMSQMSSNTKNNETASLSITPTKIVASYRQTVKDEMVDYSVRKIMVPILAHRGWMSESDVKAMLNRKLAPEFLNKIYANGLMHCVLDTAKYVQETADAASLNREELIAAAFNNPDVLFRGKRVLVNLSENKRDGLELYSGTVTKIDTGVAKTIRVKLDNGQSIPVSIKLGYPGLVGAFYGNKRKSIHNLKDVLPHLSRKDREALGVFIGKPLKVSQKFSVGDRVLVNLGDKREPEIWVATVGRLLKKNLEVMFDDGDEAVFSIQPNLEGVIALCKDGSFTREEKLTTKQILRFVGDAGVIKRLGIQVNNVKSDEFSTKPNKGLGVTTVDTKIDVPSKTPSQTKLPTFSTKDAQAARDEEERLINRRRVIRRKFKPLEDDDLDVLEDSDIEKIKDILSIVNKRDYKPGVGQIESVGDRHPMHRFYDVRNPDSSKSWYFHNVQRLR